MCKCFSCWQDDPNKRPSFEAIVTMLTNIMIGPSPSDPKKCFVDFQGFFCIPANF